MLALEYKDVNSGRNSQQIEGSSTNSLSVVYAGKLESVKIDGILCIEGGV